MYDSIQTIKIQNYIYFLKYISLISCLYVDHDFYIQIFKFLDEKEKLKTQELNKANFIQLQKNKINLYDYAYLCLDEKTKSFTDSHLSNIIKIKKIKNSVKKVSEINKLMGNEVLEKGLKDGYYDNGSWYSRDAIMQTRSMFSMLKDAMKDYDLRKYALAINNSYNPEIASDIERFFERNYNKNVMLLEKEGYKIKTAFDYYTAIDIVSSQKQSQNSQS